MTTSTDVMEHIGDVDLLLPRRIQAGLAANDRLKYYLTLLQSAVAAAQTPHRDHPNLRDARDASGVTDVSFDEVIAQSRLLGDGCVVVPSAGRIRQLVFHDLREMLAPIAAAAQVIPDLQDSVDRFDARLRALDASTPSFDADHVTPSAVDAMAASGAGPQDSVHQVVMDLHQQINRLQMRLPLRDIAGASTWGLGAEDEPSVAAFMAGLSRTAHLKFNHPGLETTATRVGGRLSIQNDLGTTDAHVVVVHVEGLAVTMIYSDVHRRRVDFLKSMLEDHNVVWADMAPGGPASPMMVVGRVDADSPAALQQFLALLASRLVFLIDWNRARKQLGRFVRKSDAVATLEWAAEHNVGHRAFLQCGGSELIYTAFERAATRHALAGGRLDAILGRTEANTFLRSVLHVASAGLTAGRSDRVIHDEVEARLLVHLAGGAHNGLSLVADHAAYLTSLAERVRRALLPGAGRAETAHGAQLAKRWEARADDLVRRQRQFQDSSHVGEMLRRILRYGDDAVDGLEEAAFLMTLVPEPTAEPSLQPLATLADLVLDGAREYVRCVERAKSLPGEHVGEFLAVVDRVLDAERAVDDVERQARATLLATSADFRELHVLSAVVRAFEQTADALAHSALAVRDYVISGMGDRA